MMEFLLSLVKLKLAALTPLYPACIKSAMTWVPVEQVRNLLILINAIICVIIEDDEKEKRINPSFRRKIVGVL